LEHTTNTNLRKTHRDLLFRVLSTIGSRIFLAADGRARERGWQVVSRHGGLSRNYRDPRFDLLSDQAATTRQRQPERGRP